ncbi:MAG: OmpA family protein [Prevotella sp.]|nr:OmpA family protein [Prevotella sp.]
MKFFFIVALITLSLNVNSQTKRSVPKTKAATSQSGKVAGTLDPRYNGVVGDYLPFSVKFQSGQAAVSPAGLKNIKDVATFMHNHENVDIVIVGYSKGGSNINQCNKVAEQRALAVKQVLVKNYGISVQRIITNSGGVDNGFARIFTGTSDAVVFHEQGFYTQPDFSSSGAVNGLMEHLQRVLAAGLLSIMFDDNFGEVSCSYCGGSGYYGGAPCPKCNSSGTVFSESKTWDDTGKIVNRAMKQSKGTSSGKQASAPQSTGTNGYQVKVYDDGIYEGYLTNGKRNGMGLFYYKNGDRYVGEWKNDKISGRGMMRKNLLPYSSGKNPCNRSVGTFIGTDMTGDRVIWKSVGDIYIGGMDEKGNYSGKGVMTYSDGNKYDGEWMQGKHHGMGTLYYANGNKYVGEFCNGDITGKGKLWYADGSYVEGYFKSGRVSGKGRYHWANGGTYEGDFVNGAFHGKGIRTWTNGNRYEGDFKNDKQDGYGVMKLNEGDVYKGQFINNDFDGNGTFTFANGDFFEGKFVKGKRVWGMYKWTNGNVYVGGFKDKLLDGEGTVYFTKDHVYRTAVRSNNMIVKEIEEGIYVDGDLDEKDNTKKYSNGDVYVGRMKWGLPNGNGTYTWANGDKYEGQFVYGKKQGQGRMMWANGEVYNGDFYGDNISGRGTKTWPNGEKYVGEFLAGKRHREGTMYYKDHKYKYGIWASDNIGVVYEEGKWTDNYKKNPKK